MLIPSSYRAPIRYDAQGYPERPEEPSRYTRLLQYPGPLKRRQKTTATYCPNCMTPREDPYTCQKCHESFDTAGDGPMNEFDWNTRRLNEIADMCDRKAADEHYREEARVAYAKRASLLREAAAVRVEVPEMEGAAF